MDALSRDPTPMDYLSILANIQPLSLDAWVMDALSRDPTPTDYLSILADIQPAELRRQRATLFLAYRNVIDPNTYSISYW